MHLRDGKQVWLAADAIAPFEKATGALTWVGTSDERERLWQESR
jgi:hypothetical protein